MPAPLMRARDSATLHNAVATRRREEVVKVAALLNKVPANPNAPSAVLISNGFTWKLFALEVSLE